MFGSRSSFDKLLEKATSQLLLEPDWDSILQISDCIRQGDVPPKQAVAAIKRKIGTENPHVSLYALQVLESCMKNCGSTLHSEVATKECMEFLKNLVTVRGEPVKGKLLELIQVWSHAFRNEPSYKIIQDTYNLMKLEGYNFPQLKESDAMFSAERAPEWKDADCCSRCRSQFSMMQRKHHCRACGDVVCAKCSGKSSIIPKYGIEREVRVCDSCYDKINKGAAGSGKSGEDDLPAEYLNSPLSKQSQVAPQKTEQEIKEEEELQLALALSKSEEESKSKERERLRNNYGIYGGVNGQKEPTSSSAPAQIYQPPVESAPMIDTADMDPELARYLNRNYWQQKAESSEPKSNTSTATATTQPSAPVALSEPKITYSGGKVQEAYQNGAADEDQEQFLHALNKSIDIFVNRMRSNSQRGRSIATDSSVQSLFNVISNMHPQLMKYIQEQEELRAHYEALQDKLAQLRDAREALDALREDHREKKRREMEELERQRQIQMAYKLDIMRQKKHEYLEMQRQLALQRLQEQEREMQMRFEQQRQLTQMRQMQNYGYNQPPYPQGPMTGVPQGYNPAGPGGVQMEGSPVHQMHGQAQGYVGQMPPQQIYAPPPAGNQPTYQQAGPAGGQGMYQQPMLANGQQTGQPSQGGPQGQYMNQTDGGPSPASVGSYPGMEANMQAQGGGGAYQPQSTGQFNSGVSGMQSLPPQGGPSYPHGQYSAYRSIPIQQSVGDYQQGAFNMQGMANSLPNGEGQNYGQQHQHQPQQYLQQGGASQGQPYQQPQGQVQQHQGQMAEPQGRVIQHQPGPNEAELISFD